MQHRFIKKQNCINEITITTENELLSIKIYKEILINI